MMEGMGWLLCATMDITDGVDRMPARQVRCICLCHMGTVKWLTSPRGLSGEKDDGWEGVQCE